MIATGLIFLLGALVATLLTLLFVPILWRNAQRLARRDYAATMPATMNEIRAEVDRVRADAAMTVRRNEMSAQKAREQVAREWATVGRLSAAHAKSNFMSEQHRDEASALRAQLASLNEKHAALEEEHARLERENQDLRETLAEAEAEMRVLEDEAKAALSARSNAAPDGAAPDEKGSPDDVEATRIAAATSALLALAREQRQGRIGERADGAREEPRAPATLAPALRGAPSQGSVPSLALEPGEGQLVDELNALAAAPRPTDPTERERRNERVRERIADVAARIIQRSAANAPAGSPVAAMVAKRSGDSLKTSSSEHFDLAERVQRLARPRADTVAHTSGPPSDGTLETEPLPRDATPPTGGKRRRGGARSRQRSPR